MNLPNPSAPRPVTVGLLVTCLVDLMRPRVGFAAVKLLEAAGCIVVVPDTQTCCGRPAHAEGDVEAARVLARRVIDAFAGLDYVVVPSGSCAAMVRVHYPDLFADEPDTRARAESLAARTFELTEFLTAVRPAAGSDSSAEGPVTYHDSCSGRHELGIKEAPRALLATVSGVELREGEAAETCCGFGGTFCLRYPDIAGAMADAKVDDIAATGASLVVGGELGCLLNIAGRLRRRGLDIEVRHIAEVLAGPTGPAIGAPRSR